MTTLFDAEMRLRWEIIARINRGETIPVIAADGTVQGQVRHAPRHHHTGANFLIVRLPRRSTQ